ncbi:hypothetical protein [Thermoanaerobacter sp. RKWS2]|uniref:hypothetical protein n=1 Tax=Thermoanaerobacter sp. RKWS2 TaxID=2983842 RepID=UPI00224A92F4|nr:hypothetical protein [Thermoanaerobacter sp. RKWS2]UZQ83390.1 hypothetical protein OEI98_000431 [Thermoanaerobacter sp. RKWS2]
MEYLIEPLNSRNSKDIVKPDSVQVDPGPVMGCSIYYCPVDWMYGGVGKACDYYCASYCYYRG